MCPCEGPRHRPLQLYSAHHPMHRDLAPFEERFWITQNPSTHASAHTTDNGTRGRPCLVAPHLSQLSRNHTFPSVRGPHFRQLCGNLGYDIRSRATGSTPHVPSASSTAQIPKFPGEMLPGVHRRNGMANVAQTISLPRSSSLSCLQGKQVARFPKINVAATDPDHSAPGYERREQLRSSLRHKKVVRRAKRQEITHEDAVGRGLRADIACHDR